MVLAYLAATPGLAADVAKIGVVEFQRLFENSDAGKEIKAEITEKGKKELQRILPKMTEVFRLMTAELSLNEKLHAVGFLKQMNDFHTG